MAVMNILTSYEKEYIGMSTWKAGRKFAEIKLPPKNAF